jgi:hypothetical protein
MPDIFPLVPHMSWRGEVYPIAARQVSFRHEQIEHKIQYQSGDIIETTGPHSYLFRYTIPMRQDIAKGPYKDLFNTGLTRLVRACRDRAPGPLIDPFYGEFRAVCVSFDETVDVNKRDGTDVTIEFLHSPAFDEGEPLLLDNITGIEGLVSDAGGLEGELTAADWNQEPSPEGVTDILSAINGVGQKGLRQVERVSAKLDDLAYKLNKIDETANQAENPDNWRLRDSVRNALDATLRIQKRVAEDPSKKVDRVTTRYAKTLSVIAAESGMTIVELLKLNPALQSKGPLVPGGTEVKVLRRGKP